MEKDLIENQDLRKNGKSSFAGDVLTLASGTTLAQILGVLLSPLLTRLYSPDAFGIAAVFTSITSIIGVIACLRYELAIMLPENDEESANLVGLSAIFSILISILTFVVFKIGGRRFLWWINSPELEPFLFLIPLSVFISGLYLAFNYWITRTKGYKELSITRLIQSVINNGAKLSLGSTGYNTGGAMVGSFVAGKTVSTLYLGFQIWRLDRKLFLEALDINKIKYVLKRYKKFPQFNIWAAFLNTISWQLPAIMLAKFFSSAEVGYYALGFRTLQMPMSFLGKSIGQVFFQRSSEALKMGRISSLVETTFKQLVNFGLFPILLLSLVGGELFSFVFGPEWSDAGLYAQILAVWGFVWFISSPFSTLNSVFEKQEFGLFINALIFLTRLISLVIGGLLNNIIIGLVLFSISGILVYGYLNIWLMNLANVSYKKIFAIIVNNVIWFSPSLLIILFLKIIGVNSFWILLATLFSGVHYLVYLWTTVPQLKQYAESFNLTRRKE